MCKLFNLKNFQTIKVNNILLREKMLLNYSVYLKRKIRQLHYRSIGKETDEVLVFNLHVVLIGACLLLVLNCTCDVYIF